VNKNSVTTTLPAAVLSTMALLASLSCSRQARVVWQQQFSSDLSDVAVSVVTDSNDIIVGANCRDTAYGKPDLWELLRYDANGKLLWQKRYDRGTSDALAAVVVAADHDIIAVGSTTPAASGSRTKLLLARFSPLGVPRWQKEYDLGLDAIGTALAVDSSGRITVCGTIIPRTPHGGYDILLAQFDSTGNVLRLDPLDFGANEFGADMSRYHDRHATFTLAAGMRLPPPQATDSLSNRDIVFFGIDAADSVLWREFYASGGEDARVRLAGLSAAVSSSAGIHVLSFGNRWCDWGILADTRYSEDSNATCVGLTADRGNHVLGVGTAGPKGHQYLMGWRYFRGRFLRFLPNEGYIPGPNDRATDIALDAAGNAIVVGTSDSGRKSSVLVLKAALPRYKPPPGIWLPNMYR